MTALTNQTKRRLIRKQARLTHQLKGREMHLKKVQEVGTLYEQMQAEIEIIKVRYELKEVNDYLGGEI